MLCTPWRGHLHARLAPGAVFRIEGEPVERKQTRLWPRGVLFCSLLLLFCLKLLHSLLLSYQLLQWYQSQRGITELGRLLPWVCFFSSAMYVTRAWKQKGSCWHLKMRPLGCPTDKKGLFCYKPSLFGGVTLSSGGSAVKEDKQLMPVITCVLSTACTLVPLHGCFALVASVLPPGARWASLPSLVGKMCLPQQSHPSIWVTREAGSSL